LYLWK